MSFTKIEKNIISGLLPKFAALRSHDSRVRVISFSALAHTLYRSEKDFLKQFLLIDPHQYGFKGPRYGLSRVPNNLVTIKKETAGVGGAVITRGVHYLPQDVHLAYRRMNRVMLRDIGRRVFVESGYRSPAYQCILFLEFLAEDNFDIKKTLTRIAFPGYSEHHAPQVQAIDFITEDREDNSVKNPIFENTKEYLWLSQHAREYGFVLSYPRGNEWGVAFEPWHWHYGRTSVNGELLRYGGPNTSVTV